MRALIGLIGLASIFGSGAPAHAKELYLTVRRDFAPKEHPVIELNYVATGPVTVRVLKPKDMAAFIASQIDLRRAWKKPGFEENAARYLVRGLNNTRMDLGWLRTTPNAEMRRALKKQYGGAEFQSAGSHLPEGPKTLIAIPENFELAEEFVVYPEEKDAGAPFDVPGWDWWFGHEHGGLKTKEMKLTPLSPGFYVAQVIQGNLEGQVIVVVNDILGQLQQSEGMAIVRASDRSGSAKKGVNVRIRNLSGKWIDEAHTDKDGVAAFRGIKDSDLVVVMEDKSGTAVIDSEFYSTTASFPDLYLYTDRPLYKPGDEIHFKGVLRERTSGVSRLVDRLLGRKSAVEVSVVDVTGERKVEAIQVDASEFGTFSGDFKLPDLGGGVYRVAARLLDAEHVGEFRVENYIKPIFYLKVETKQESLSSGTKLKAKVSVRRFAGGVPQNVEYRAELFRVRRQSPQWVEDAGLGETGSTTTYGLDANASPDVSVPIPILKEEELKFDAQGNSNLELDLPSELPGEPNLSYQIVLKIFAKDADGNTGATSKSFQDSKTEIMAAARASSVLVTGNAKVDLEVRGFKPSGSPFVKAAGRLEWLHKAYRKNEKVIHAENFTTDDNGRFRTKSPDAPPGRLTARVLLDDGKGGKSGAETDLVVAPENGTSAFIDTEDLTLMPFKNEYRVGDTARALVLLPEKWGEKNGNQGRLFITTAGNTVFDSRVQPVDGRYAWIEQKIEERFGGAVYLVVSYADPVKGWTERQVKFKIPPEDKRLKVKIAVGATTLMPGEEQTLRLSVVDWKGNPSRAELSVAVVDKAVLTLQPQIRPPLEEFFYPTDRLNLMTFLSNEFQSYGYGEKLARLFRPNYMLAATKSEKNSLERDTAYWNAQVVTDEAGAAKVSFQLPANQTIWDVSVIAADKQGRFGEGGAEFKANRSVSLLAANPEFLREGDTAKMRFIVAADRPSLSKAVGLRLASDDPIRILGASSFNSDPSSKSFSGKEIHWNTEIRMDKRANSGSAKIQAQMSFGKGATPYAYQIKSLSGAAETTESVPLAKNGSGSFNLRNDEAVRSASVIVTAGVSGTIIPALEWLLTYPYGCVEQLVSTTVPHLVMIDLLKSTNGTNGQAGGDNWMSKVKSWGMNVYQKIKPGAPVDIPVARYEEFARAGLNKLGKYQNDSGAFAWFPGQGDENRAMTALVMMTIAASNPRSVSVGVNFNKAAAWLMSHVGQASMGSPEAVIAHYVDARLVESGMKNSSPREVESKVRFLLDYVANSGTLLEKALMLMAVKDYGLAASGDIPKLIRPLVDQVRATLKSDLEAPEKNVKPAVWSPLANGWSLYPGRVPSTMAIAAHALQAHGALNGQLRELFVRRLLQHFNGAHFGSTFETAQVLLHTAWLVREELVNRKSSPPPQILVNGKPATAGKSQVRPSLTGWIASIDAASFSKGNNRVELQATGDASVARLRLVKSIPYDKIEAGGQGWELKKTYYQIDEKAGGIKEIDPQTAHLKVGDLVYVKIDFTPKNNAPWWRSNYYVVRDEIPAGMSVVQEDKAYEAAPYNLYIRNAKYKTREVNLSDVRWYFEFDHGWMDRDRSLGYVMRAGYAGNFASGIAKLEDFYDEESFATTNSRRFAIDPVRAD